MFKINLQDENIRKFKGFKVVQVLKRSGSGRDLGLKVAGFTENSNFEAIGR